MAKTSTINSISVTHYGDANTTGTSFTFSPAKTGYEIAEPTKDHSLGSNIFHSFKVTLSTNNETVGLEPIAIGGFYRVDRKSL